MLEAVVWAVVLTLGFGLVNSVWVVLFLKAEAIHEQEIPAGECEPLSMALAAPFAHARA